MLNSQAAKVKGMTRTDPLAKLPYELIRMILQEVGFRTLWYNSSCLGGKSAAEYC